MRLDHLLSKEHLTRLALVGRAEARPEPYAFGVVLEGGTSTTAVIMGRHRVSTPPCGDGTRTADSPGGRLGTLLGPEGTAREGGCFMTGPVGRTNRLLPSGAGRRRRARLGDRSLFENCTVDASIFKYVFVVKFLRAQGGCLGTRSRRRTS